MTGNAVALTLPEACSESKFRVMYIAVALTLPERLLYIAITLTLPERKFSHITVALTLPEIKFSHITVTLTLQLHLYFQKENSD